MVVTEIDKLSRDDLVEALVYTNCTGHELSTTRQEIRKYYNLLSVEELKVKASKGQLLYPDKPTKLDARETKRRELEIEKNKRPERKPVVKDFNVTIHVRQSLEDQLIAELLYRSWIEDAVEVAPNVIGIKFNMLDLELGKKRVKAIARRVGYKGDIIYG